MMTLKVGLILICLYCVAWATTAPPAASKVPNLTLQLRQRPEPKAQPIVTPLSIPASKVGIVLVDTWDNDWCMTNSERFASFFPRMNKVLECYRKLGVQVFWGPTDVADHYVGTPQREKALAVPPHPLPPPIKIGIPDPPMYPVVCICGPGIPCQMNFGFQAMAADLKIMPEDLIVEGSPELYSWCIERGITHLLYMGFATNVCLLNKNVGVGQMSTTGIKIIIARDMTDGWYPYDLDKGLMPDAIQDETIATLEKAVPSIDAVSELKKAGLWKDAWIVDPVRMAPWGREERPYIFAQSTRVSLTAPLDEGVKIYYTLDGTKPGLSSKLYSSPITVTKTTTIRATAFRGNKQACLESAGYYVPLPPALPAPDVHISDLKGLRETSGGYNTAANERYRIPRTRLPAKDQSKNSTPLMLRQNQYGKGVGVEAPSMLMYEVKPEYDRFVAECGVDEYLLWDEIGAARALFPKLKFKVFIDGKLVAESPWQRFAQQPWRFDVKIPFLSRAINLVVVPSEDSRYSFADWVNAGFVTKK